MFREAAPDELCLKNLERAFEIFEGTDTRIQLFDGVDGVSVTTRHVSRRVKKCPECKTRHKELIIKGNAYRPTRGDPGLYRPGLRWPAKYKCVMFYANRCGVVDETSDVLVNFRATNWWESVQVLAPAIWQCFYNQTRSC